MNILSYRGPGKAGGVSGVLARIVDGNSDNNIHWWHLDGASLITKTRDHSHLIGSIPEAIVEGHYRHCNNLLWPVLHDMPERALSSPDDRENYRRFNGLFALSFLRAQKDNLVNRDRAANQFFIQDYQLALLPSKISCRDGEQVNIFWHIPWPQSVERVHVEALVEVAEGLLSANKLGFHVEEYAVNFMNFVRLHLPLYEVDFDSRQIVGIRSKLLKGNNSNFTQIVVSPLGLDLKFWTKKALEAKPAVLDLEIRRVCSSPYILSVDRADYTKGILQRIAAIDHLFENQPHLRGTITFLQVCQPSRVGLPQFDRYWQQTQRAMSELNDRFRQGKWQPLVWIAEPVIASHLAHLYAEATAMLVSPLRDGLNLTAKEFITCSKKEDSLLLLSSGAGVWQEVGDLAMTINASAPIVAAQQIAGALALPKVEKVRRMRELKARVQANPLDTWWKDFTNYEGQYTKTSSTCATEWHQVVQWGAELQESKHVRVPTTSKE